MKKYMVLSAVIILLISMLTVPAVAAEDDGPETSAEEGTAEAEETEELENGDYRYKVNEDGSITLVKYIGEDAVVVTPEEIDGKPVTVIGEACFRMQKQLSGVQVSEGVVEIEDIAFAENGDFGDFTGAGIFKVVLPKTLKVIGSEVFQNTRITNIYFYDGLESIGDNLCSFAYNLSRIRIPDSVESIGRMPFLGVAAGGASNKTLKIYGGKVAERVAEDYQYGEYAGDDMGETSIASLLEELEEAEEEPAERVRQIYFDNRDTGYENVSFPEPKLENDKNSVLFVLQIVLTALLPVLLVIIYGRKKKC